MSDEKLARDIMCALRRCLETINEGGCHPNIVDVINTNSSKLPPTFAIAVKAMCDNMRTTLLTIERDIMIIAKLPVPQNSSGKFVSIADKDFKNIIADKDIKDIANNG